MYLLPQFTYLWDRIGILSLPVKQVEFNWWEEALHSFTWRPFRSAGRCDVWVSLVRLVSALHFSALLFAVHMLANATQQHLFCCCGTPYSRCIGLLCWPAVCSACDPGSQVEIVVLSSICRALSLQERPWAQGGLPAGI